MEDLAEDVEDELAGIGDLLERVATRMAVHSVRRLDRLLIQVLVARVSLALVATNAGLPPDLDLDDAAAEPRGSPPISPEDLQRLPRVVVAPEHLQCSDKAACLVCLEAFHVGTRVTQLPCSHLFCSACAERWLRQHRTCPMCRVEVVDVPAQVYRYDLCGVRQLDPRQCLCHDPWHAPSLTPLPGCSHSFGPFCLRTYAARRSSASPATLQCPLCGKGSPVDVTQLPKPRPLSRGQRLLTGRAPAHWRSGSGGDGGP